MVNKNGTVDALQLLSDINILIRKRMSISLQKKLLTKTELDNDLI